MSTYKGKPKGASKGACKGTLGIGSGLDPPSEETGKGGLGGFEKFWLAYPRKTAKKVARKAWDRLNADAALEEKIHAALAKQRLSRQWQQGIIPHPATWLNQARWEDEGIAVPAGSNGKPPETNAERMARVAADHARQAESLARAEAEHAKVQRLWEQGNLLNPGKETDP